MSTSQIIQTILSKRQIADLEVFLHPKEPKELAIYPKGSADKTYALITNHIKAKNKIIIYGDYDVDGLCSTAILWETLFPLDANTEPFIPDRIDDGYGLTISGIDKCIAKGARLIIAVDNGIVAHSQIAYAKERGVDILIIDHHQRDDKELQADSVLHSESGCAAALTWKFCTDYFPSTIKTDNLGLAALASVCDLVPLLGFSRSVVKYGLPLLRQSTRIGLRALCEVAAIRQNEIDTYHCGFILGPRLNSTGRLESALTSLQLLCTKDVARAQSLALTINQTNAKRQEQTEESVTQAIDSFDPSHLPDVLLVASSNFHPGIIGLIAAKLTERYTRPSIAVAILGEQAKASARSIQGFDITQSLRQTCGELLLSVGGHAMAAGFSCTSDKLSEIKKRLEAVKIDQKLLVKKVDFDVELEPEDITLDLYTAIQDLAPFGVGNPTPKLQTSNFKFQIVRHAGQNKQHVIFKLGDLEAIWFNYEPEKLPKLAKIVGTLDCKTWQGTKQLQLIVKHGLTKK